MWNGNNNNFDEVAKYLNEELKKGRTQKDIEINDFNVTNRTIEKRLNRRGYKKINNQYIKNIEKDKNVLNIHNINKHITSVITDKKNIDEKSITTVINDKNIKEKMLELVNNYDKILKIIEQYDKKYECEYDKIYTGITIEVPIETVKDFRTTVRINNIIWNQFNDFCNNNKQFTKRDLLSMALKEYMENHK